MRDHTPLIITYVACLVIMSVLACREIQSLRHKLCKYEIEYCTKQEALDKMKKELEHE